MPGGDGAVDRFIAKVDGLVAFMERNRLSLFGIFVYVLAISFVRDLSEYFLLDHEFITTAHPWIFSIAHHVSFYMVTFLGLVLLLSAFSGRGVRRSANVIASIFWIVLLPPFLDHFLFGLSVNYSYSSATDFLDALVHFSGSSFHPGQVMEIAVVLFTLFGYVLWQAKDDMDTVRGRGLAVLRVGSAVFFSFLTMFILATPGAYLPVGSAGGYPVFPNFETTRFVQFHQLLTAYYVVIGCVILLLLGVMALGHRLLVYLRALRPAQTFFFAGIVLAGMALGWSDRGGDQMILSILQTPYWVNLAYAVIGLIAPLLVWHVSAMWNDISDRRTDDRRSGRLVASETVPRGTYLSASLVLLAVAVMLSLLLSPLNVLIVCVLAGLAYLYSFPPLRLKMHVLSPLLIGLGTALAFICGYVTPFSEVAGFAGTDVLYLTGAVISASVSPFALLVSLFMCLGLVVGSMVTDIEGYEEDSRAGVKTVYTVAGMEKGTMAMAVVIFLSALTPLVLLPTVQDLAVLVILGSLAAMLFYRRRSPYPVMLLAAIGLVYAGLRLFLV
jgi:4-hydroxybenzoate polyprenyltransferase